MSRVPDLKAWLKAHPSDESELKLRRPAVKALFDEMQNLRQGSEFTRKQNKKLRFRIQKLKAGEPDPAGGATDGLDDADAGLALTGDPGDPESPGD